MEITQETTMLAIVNALGFNGNTSITFSNEWEAVVDGVYINFVLSGYSFRKQKIGIRLHIYGSDLRKVTRRLNYSNNYLNIDKLKTKILELSKINKQAIEFRARNRKEAQDLDKKRFELSRELKVESPDVLRTYYNLYQLNLVLTSEEIRKVYTYVKQLRGKV